VNPTPAPTSAEIGGTSLPAVSQTFSSAPPSSRDRALDVIRGFAIVAMLSTHVGPMSRVTALIHLPLWVSAIDFFVLTSGFVIGMKSARELGRRPSQELYRWLLRRALMLYGVHCTLTLFVLIVHGVTGRLDAPDVGSVGGWPRAIALVLALRLQPGDFMNILPLYVVFLAMTPLVIEGCRRRVSLGLLAASGFLWLLSQRNAHIVPLPDPALSSAPFSLGAWQFVFVLGLLAGFHRESLARALRALGPGLPIVLCVATVGLFVLAQLERDVFKPAGYTIPAAMPPLLAKQTFAPIHAVYALGLVVIGYLAIDRLVALASRSSLSRPMSIVNGTLEGLSRLGRKSLYSFQIHLVFALIASAAGVRAWPAWSQDLLVLASIALLHEFARRNLWQRYIPN
jgi:hypothetical protein